MLVDWKETGDFFLYREMQKAGFEVRLIDLPYYTMRDRTVRLRIFLLYFKYLLQAFKVIRLSTPDDIIVCWNFTTGIGVGFIARLLFRKRCILAVNMIAHFSSKVVSFIRYIVFHSAMSWPGFYLTVNASDYISLNAKRFNISKKNFFVLHDPVKNRFDFAVDVRDDRYVFTGGEAQRDWRIFFDMAQQLPDISFTGVARKKFFDSELVVPANVDMRFDLDYERFSQLMAAATLVVLPLVSTFPCGLIVIGDAGLMKKAVIATRTPSTENYIITNKTGVLVELGDVETMKNEVQRLFADNNERKRLGDNLNEFLFQEFSIQNYFERFVQILEKIEAEQA